MDDMPEPITDIPCQCVGHPLAADECICPATERMLRRGGPFTAAQREWCLNEIGRVEGFRREDHIDEDDKQLGRSVISAWTDYCRDKGLM